MKKITRWTPDTCDCAIEYEWDTDDAPETRTHVVKSVGPSAIHSGTPEEVYTKVVEENKNKNKAVAKVMEDNDLAEDVPDGKGGTVRKMKEGKEVKWSFDKDRNLEVEIIGADATKKAAVENEISKVVAKGKFKLK